LCDLGANVLARNKHNRTPKMIVRAPATIGQHTR
jgi:hypothetical protein